MTDNPWHWMRGVTGTGPEPIALGAKVTKEEVLAEELKAATFPEPKLGKVVWINPDLPADYLEKIGRLENWLPSPGPKAKFGGHTPDFIAVDESADLEYVPFVLDNTLGATAASFTWLLDGTWPSEKLTLKQVAERWPSPEHHRSQPPQPSGMATEPSTRDGVYDGIDAIPDREAIANIVYSIVDDRRWIRLVDGRAFWADERDYKRRGLAAKWHLLPEDDGA